MFSLVFAAKDPVISVDVSSNIAVDTMEVVEVDVDNSVGNDDDEEEARNDVPDAVCVDGNIDEGAVSRR